MKSSASLILVLMLILVVPPFIPPQHTASAQGSGGVTVTTTSYNESGNIGSQSCQVYVEQISGSTVIFGAVSGGYLNGACGANPGTLSGLWGQTLGESQTSQCQGSDCWYDPYWATLNWDGFTTNKAGVSAYQCATGSPNVNAFDIPLNQSGSECPSPYYNLGYSNGFVLGPTLPTNRFWGNYHYLSGGTDTSQTGLEDMYVSSSYSPQVLLLFNNQSVVASASEAPNGTFLYKGDTQYDYANPWIPFENSSGEFISWAGPTYNATSPWYSINVSWVQNGTAWVYDGFNALTVYNSSNGFVATYGFQNGQFLQLFNTTFATNTYTFIAAQDSHYIVEDSNNYYLYYRNNLLYDWPLNAVNCGSPCVSLDPTGKYVYYVSGWNWTDWQLNITTITVPQTTPVPTLTFYDPNPITYCITDVNGVSYTLQWALSYDALTTTGYNYTLISSSQQNLECAQFPSTSGSVYVLARNIGDLGYSAWVQYTLNYNSAGLTSVVNSTFFGPGWTVQPPGSSSGSANGIIPIYPQLPVYTIEINNTQNEPTPTPFQQLLVLNMSSVQSVKPDLSNLAFYGYLANYSGLLLPYGQLHAWLEAWNASDNQAVIWVNLPNGIPADSHVNIYMEVLPQNYTFDGVMWGEAPQLSSTYGAYDNGQFVFDYYTNFTSMPTSLNLVKGGSGNATANGNLTLTVSASGDYAFVYPSSNFSGETVDANVIQQSNGTSMELFDSVNTTAGFNVNGTLAGYTGSDVAYGGSFLFVNGTPFATSNLYAGLPQVLSLQWLNNSNVTELAGYTSMVTGKDSSITPQPSYDGAGIAYNSSAGNITLQWFRVRQTPPYGVMPSVNWSFTGYGANPPLAPQYEVFVNQEENPYIQNPDLLYVSVGDTAGFSSYINTTNYGVAWFIDESGATVNSVAVTSGTSGLTRLWQWPLITNTTGIATITVYFPYTQVSLSGYSIYFLYFTQNVTFTVYTEVGGFEVWNSSVGTTSLGVPLLYGHQYIFVVTQTDGTNYTYSEVASNQQSIGLAPPITHTPDPNVITWTADWYANSSFVQLYFNDPNGFVSGTAQILNAQQNTVLYQATINSSTWTQNVVMPYSTGMVAKYVIQDENGGLTGYTSVINVTSATPSNQLSFPTINLPNIGLGILFGTSLGGFADGDYGWYTLFALVVLALVAALFSEKHQDIGALVLAGMAAFFAFIQWVPLLTTFISSAVIISFLLFFKRASRGNL
ncbi:MAG: hypothetical protein JRN68_05695 [Nitrososphaerota archaeon]|nr:hypothetical protein [Nitrososphaerota archaeon]